jgi:hypothetical protein
MIPWGYAQPPSNQGPPDYPINQLSYGPVCNITTIFRLFTQIFLPQILVNDNFKIKMTWLLDLDLDLQSLIYFLA